MFEYKAIVERVVDGDTLDLRIDLGFKIYTNQRVRLARINAYETTLRYGTTEEEKQLGLQGKEYVKNLLEGKEVKIISEKTGKYGRYIVEVYYGDINLNDDLVQKKFAIYQEY